MKRKLFVQAELFISLENLIFDQFALSNVCNHIYVSLSRADLLMIDREAALVMAFFELLAALLLPNGNVSWRVG